MVKAVELPASAYAFHIALGARLLYGCNAMGKCILAHLDPARVRDLFPEGETVPLARGSRTRAELMAELELVRQTGLGHDREEYLTGVACIATPVWDACGQVIGGVGITFLCARPDALPEHEKERLVVETGRRISTALGFVSSTT
jgi:DNA-binding IclR family transcriptional regulator